MGNIGWTELIVIFGIVLVFFGPRRLPELAGALGKSLREFRRALNEVRSEITQSETWPQSRGEDAERAPQLPTSPDAAAGPDAPAAAEPTGGAGAGEASAGSREPSAGSREPSAGSQEPATGASNHETEDTNAANGDTRDSHER